ncbi:MAG TPA: helix-turn-helix domain-containing protein [Candidatus Acidoferrum sp.]|nr:helix-turn-helix domain-containing protein [Candidatus Acidoferrum sp.]
MTEPSTTPVADAAPRASERQRPAVGCEVRRWRRDRGLTLSQVAEKSGLNVGYLSQIENDKASPSLETLASLGAALDVPMTWFLIDSTRPPRVVRATERVPRAFAGGGSLDEVDGGIPRDLRIIRATLPPRVATGLHGHAGDEHHLVISGRIRATQGAHTVELGAGDYLLWDATIPHDVETLGDEPAVLLLVSHSAHSDVGARRDEGRQPA